MDKAANRDTERKKRNSKKTVGKPTEDGNCKSGLRRRARWPSEKSKENESRGRRRR